MEHSLNSEAKLISQIRVLLKDKCEAAWDKLAVLEDIRQRLELDLQDKTTALAIDINQIELTERSGGISHKPDSIKCPNGFVYFIHSLLICLSSLLRAAVNAKTIGLYIYIIKQ